MKPLLLSAIALAAFVAFPTPQTIYALTGNTDIGTSTFGSKLAINGSFAAACTTPITTTYLTQL
jgi:hypothetical protein